MTLDDIDLPRALRLEAVAVLVEEAVDAAGLRVAQRGTLAAYPGSVFWRLRRGQDKGALEVTLLNRERRLTLSAPPNRAADWTEAALEALSDDLRQRIAEKHGGGDAPA